MSLTYVGMKFSNGFTENVWMILFDDLYMLEIKLEPSSSSRICHKTILKIFLAYILSSNHVFLDNWKKPQEMDKRVLVAGIHWR